MTFGITQRGGCDNGHLPVSPVSLWWPERMVASAWQVHAPFGFWLVDAVRPKLIVEWNVRDGFSSAVCCQAIRNLGLPTCYRAFHEDARDAANAAENERSYQALADYIEQHYAAFATVTRSMLADAYASVADGAIDLLHLDYTHGENNARRIFDEWIPKLTESGIALIHGTRLGGKSGARDLWVSLCKRYPSFEFTHGAGLGLVSVGERRPAMLQTLLEDRGQAAYVASMYEHLGAAVVQRFEQRGQLASHEDYVPRDDAINRGVITRSDGLDGDAMALGAIIDNQRSRLRHNIAPVAVGGALDLPRERATATSTHGHQRVARLNVVADHGTNARGRRNVAWPPQSCSKVENLSSAVGSSVRTRGWGATLRKIGGAGKRALLSAVAALGATPLFELPAAWPAQGSLALRVLIVAEMSIPQCLKYRVTQKQRMIEDLGFDCTVRRGARLRPGGRALRTAAVARAGETRRRLGAQRGACRLVYDGEGRQRRRGSASVRREPAGVAAGRFAAGLSARQRQHEPATRTPCRNPRAPRRSRTRGFLRRRDRALDLRRQPGRGRLPVARRLGRLPGPHRAAARDPLPRSNGPDNARNDGRTDARGRSSDPQRTEIRR